MPTLAVVGAGTMGTGIAYVFAGAGYDTVVVDPDPTQRAHAAGAVAAQCAKAVRKGTLAESDAAALAGRITWAAQVRAIPIGVDVAVEAVPERPEVKVPVLAAMEQLRPHLLATNTSSLRIDELAQALERPDSFLGMHFFNPVWSMPLLELVRGRATSDEAMARAERAGAAIGKQTIVVRDSPGFATSRLGVAIALEAIRMLEEGVAEAADIDAAMELGYRHPMGPLKLTDHVGLDVRLAIATYLETCFGERFTPPRLLVDKVAAGATGRKAGRGFYDWPAP